MNTSPLLSLQNVIFEQPLTCYCSALAFKIASSRPKSDDFLYFFDTICASLNKQTKILNKTEELINLQLLVISLSQNRCIHKVSDVLVSHQKKIMNISPRQL